MDFAVIMNRTGVTEHSFSWVIYRRSSTGHAVKLVKCKSEDKPLDHVYMSKHQ